MYSQRYMDRLFINLKVLSKIEEGQKLYTKEDYLMLDDGTAYKQILMRWWCGENRNTTLNKIQEIVEDSISCGQNAINSELLIQAQNRDDVEVSNKVKLRRWEAERDKFIQMDNINLLKTLSTEMDSALVGIGNLKNTYNDNKTLGSKLELEIELLERSIEKFRDFYISITSSKSL